MPDMSTSTKILVFSAIMLILILLGVSLFRKQSKAPDVQGITRSISSPETSIAYDCVKDKTALELLENKYTTETKIDNIGTMVLGINEIKPKNRQFWAFLVDGKEATVGASAYKCLGTEKVEWKLENF